MDIRSIAARYTSQGISKARWQSRGELVQSVRILAVEPGIADFRAKFLLMLIGHCALFWTAFGRTTVYLLRCC